MPGTVEQTWAIQPSHKDMQILVGPWRESAEATGRSRSNATAEKTKKASTKGAVPHSFYSASRPELFTGEEQAECNTGFHGHGWSYARGIFRGALLELASNWCRRYTHGTHRTCYPVWTTSTCPGAVSGCPPRTPSSNNNAAVPASHRLPDSYKPS